MNKLNGYTNLYVEQMSKNKQQMNNNFRYVISGLLTSSLCLPSDSRILPRSPLTPPYRCQVYLHLSRVSLPTAVYFPEAPSPPPPPTGVRCTYIFPVSAFRQPYTSPKPPHPPPSYRCQVYSHLSRVRLPTAIDFPEAPSPPPPPPTGVRCTYIFPVSAFRQPYTSPNPPHPPPPPVQVSGVLTSFPCLPSDSRRLPRSPLTLPPTGVRCTYIFPVSAFRQP